MDNEIAVQNLTKMAEQKGYQSSAKQLADQEYLVIFTAWNLLFLAVLLLEAWLIF